MTSSPSRAERFRYVGYEVDPVRLELTARYDLGGRSFEERITFAGGPEAAGPPAWAGPAVAEAARIAFLLAGVSYFKAAAPPLVDLGATPVRPGEAEFLRSFLVEGLGEFAYRNGLTLDVVVIGGSPPPPPAHYEGRPGYPLVPFGGGLDSVVSVEAVRPLAEETTLFVAGPPGGPPEALEAAVGAAGLPVTRAVRRLDPAILRSAEEGFLNGHVPVTGILSAVAVVAAVAGGHDAVVMSNEWSASVGNVEVGGRPINHQWSKGAAFEDGLRAVLAEAFTRPPEYFSLLRSSSTLAIAERFAGLERYHRVFRSCNRAFTIDPSRRLAAWCGRCDKCCFTDLVLAPFLPGAALEAVFGGREPLADPATLGSFRTLLGLSGAAKPFECVGDVDECRAATVLAADRPDRQGQAVLGALVAELGPERAGAARAGAERLRRRLAVPDNIPRRYAPADLLV